MSGERGVARVEDPVLMREVCQQLGNCIPAEDFRRQARDGLGEESLKRYRAKIEETTLLCRRDCQMGKGLRDILDGV